MWKPELLAPAKNLERLKVAVAYGADAVYLGGQQYGLRARADNFTEADLTQGVAFAHQHGAKVYVTLNAFLHDQDLEGLEDYCRFLESIGVDAVIVSDLGVIRTVRRCSNLSVHLSTQSSCLNSAAGCLWQAAGVKRLIVGRELSVTEAGSIYQRSGLEVEMFVHGAMCMAYSGHCTISNFTAGRDSNRGGCIQSCRLPYQLESQEAPLGNRVPFMSSRDLWGIYQIGDFFRNRICSLKIEGRMKSSFYVALTCKVYRQLIDAWATGTWTPELVIQAAAQLQSIPNRDYFDGSLAAPAGRDSVYGQAEGNNTGTRQYAGIVLDTTAQDLIVRLVEPLKVGDEVELVPFQGNPLRWQVQQLYTITGERVRNLRQESIARIPRSSLPLSGQAIARLNVLSIASVAEPVGHAV